MVDGTAVLTTFMHGMMAMGGWRDERGVNLLDTGAHFYEVYECADGKFLSVGAIEPQFYAELLQGTGLTDDPEFAQPERQGAVAPPEGAPGRGDPHQDPRRVGRDLRRHRRLRGPDPLARQRRRTIPTTSARKTFVERDGIVQPAPAPRFSRTAAEIQRPPAHAGQHTDEVLAEWGVADADRTAALRAGGAIA